MTIEVGVKIKEKADSCISLTDHGFEINVMSSYFNNCRRWPIEKNHSWKTWVITEVIEYVYGACPNIKLSKGDVSIDQHFFVQKKFFTAVRTETKVLNRSTFMRIKCLDGMSNSIPYYP